MTAMRWLRLSGLRHKKSRRQVARKDREEELSRASWFEEGRQQGVAFADQYESRSAVERARDYYASNTSSGNGGRPLPEREMRLRQGIVAAFNEYLANEALLPPSEQVDRYQQRTERRRTEEQNRARSEWVAAERARYMAEYEAYLKDLAQWHERHPESDGQGRPQSWKRATNHYGDEHKSLRAAWSDVIRAGGAECREAVCVMPSRGIDKGAPSSSWHLAHDHAKGGPFDYLGPAHAPCNEAESLARGRSWEGAPTLAALLASVSYEGSAYDTALERLDSPDPMPRPPVLDPHHPDSDHIPS